LTISKQIATVCSHIVTSGTTASRLLFKGQAIPCKQY
jgi:hypothetical protein